MVLSFSFYSLPRFYAEVFYDAADNKISDICSFTSNRQLAPYIALAFIFGMGAIFFP